MNPVRLAWRLRRNEPWLLVANLLLWGSFHGVPAATGWAVGVLFDRLAGADPGAPESALWLIGAILLGRLLTFEVAIYAFTTYYLRLMLLVRRNLLRHLMEAPGTRVLPVSTGTAMSTFREDAEDVAEYMENIIDGLGVGIFVGSSLWVLFGIDAGLAGIVLIPLAVALLLTASLSNRIRSHRQRMRNATERVTGFLGDLFGSIESVKAAGKEAAMLDHLAEVNAERRDAALSDSALTEILRTINRNMANVGIGAVLLAGAASIASGSLSVGGLTTFLVYIPRLTGNMAWAGDMIAQHTRTRVAYERIERLSIDGTADDLVAVDGLDLSSSIPVVRRTAEDSHLVSLEARGLTVRHDDTGAGIVDVDLSVRRGQFIVITGRVGAGKTTLLRALLGLLPLASGEIRWNGRLVDDPAAFLVPPRSAYTPQVPTLVSETLRENITMGRELPDRAVEDALHLAVLGPDIDQLEDGLDTVVGSRGVRLSGGQVQRSAAARMFATDADLLVFDDLSSALDVHTEGLLWNRLTEHRDATCLVVSHRRPALRRADAVVLMDRGRVAGVGPLDELLERSALMRELWDDEGDG